MSNPTSEWKKKNPEKARAIKLRYRNSDKGRKAAAAHKRRRRRRLKLKLLALPKHEYTDEEILQFVDRCVLRRTRTNWTRESEIGT
jgi:hypothetical protein